MSAPRPCNFIGALGGEASPLTQLGCVSSLFDDPEASTLFSTLLVELTSESPRGAILVGTAHVEACLGTFVSALFPRDVSKKKAKELTRYPGPLSTFAARIEVTYALRLLPHRVYLGLQALRKLRNSAAHSAGAFHLTDKFDDYAAIYDSLGDNLPQGIRQLALEMIFKYKLHQASKALEAMRLGDPDTPRDYLRTEPEIARFIAESPEVIKAVEEQLPHWELAVGIRMLCSLLIIHRKELVSQLGNNPTFALALKGAK